MDVQYSTGRPKISPWTVAGVGGSLAAFMILAIAAVRGSDGRAAIAVITLGVLAVLTIPMATKIARIAGDPRLFAFVMAGFGVKMLASLGRYWFAFLSSGGAADAAAYNQAGRALMPAIRQFNFGVNTGAPVPGTGFIRLLTAMVYAVVGANPAAGFLVFAWISFVGLLLFWRAFHMAVPGGDHPRYLKLVLFLPSLLFWPAGLGKEAWMIFALGLCSYGVAGVFMKRAAGFWLLPGVVAATMVRPHVALLVYCGFVFALLVRRRTSRTAATPALQIMGLGLMLALGVTLASQTAQFLGVERLTLETVDTSLEFAATQTADAGSSFTAVGINTPLDIPLATVTVLFRPLPFEAHNAQTLVAAAEGLVFLALVLTSLSRLRGTFRRMRSDPYVAYAVGFVIVFIFAFSNFSNFGILARERSQVLPFFLVLLALPKTRRRAAVGTRRSLA